MTDQKSNLTPITIAYGDGIGPEIMSATLKILKAAGAALRYDEIQIGEKLYLQGAKSGINKSDWDILRRNKVFLKAPITTPQGGGYQSLNVAIRKTLGLYANVRPCTSFHPFVTTKHPNMDVVIVRENEEDLYAGIEYRQSNDVYQCLKIITRSGCERIIRYAFDYAVANNRKKVSAFVKDNIMKLTDGVFHKVFDEISKEYPQIQSDHFIVDIGSARLADTPNMFDVIVTLNLYGDIISDIAAQIAGSVGLAGSSNIGTDFAMFEAIHGSAPNIAGQNIANPSGLLHGAILMLVHIGQAEIAQKIHNAWLATIENGYHTADIYNPDTSQKKCSCDEFADQVIAHLSQIPQKLKRMEYKSNNLNLALNQGRKTASPPAETKKIVGVDIYLDIGASTLNRVQEISQVLEKCAPQGIELQKISSKGLNIWPQCETQCAPSDNIKLRFTPTQTKDIKHQQILDIMKNINQAGFDFIKMESLCSFNDKPYFSD